MKLNRTAIAMAVAVLFFAVSGTAGAPSAAQKQVPMVTVTPDSGLTDGETVQVSGTGFQEQQVQIAQCGGGDQTAHPAVGPVCSYFTYAVDVQTDTEGSFAPVGFAVQKAFTGTHYVNGNHPVPTSYDCAPLNDCYLRIYSLTRGYRATTHPLTFAP